MSGVSKSVESRLSVGATAFPRTSRMHFAAHAVPASLAMLVFSLLGAHAQVNVTTYHNDIGRTGQNLNETILNTSNVNATQFGKLFSQPVDGQIYAQPLYLSGITVNGATHNIVFVATENDSVYAFDADSNGGANSNPLWMASMLTSAHGAAAGATTVSSNVVGSDINPQVGITGTPVIDPSTGTLYVVSKTMENSNAIQRLHALDVTTGNEKFGGPVVISPSVPGTGNGSSGGVLTFDSLWENQRPGLLLLNGIVYVGFAAHGDNGPWHGWIVGYNAATLKQTGVFCSSPNGVGAGFWMSGEGLAADQLNPTTKPYGRMFVPTGNGDYTATTPYTNNMDYGETDLDLDLTNGAPTVTDEFTTNGQAGLTAADGDVGSGGLVVLPTQTTGGYPYLAVQAGKAGTLFLLNRSNLGGYNTTADQMVQAQQYAVGNNGVWSTPAYWNGNVYYWGINDYLKSFSLSVGLLSTVPTKSSEEYNYPGATPSISADGSSQGIVWSIETDAYANPGPAILQAHNASNVAATLYSSATNPTRDTAGNAVKFAVPTVVNGKVYVGDTELDVYGLLNASTQTSAPLLTPGTEDFSNSAKITITDATAGASIYYTTNGTTPTTSSTHYTSPITITSSETINAIASATGLATSEVTSAVYTNVSQVAAVVFSLPTGTYGSAQSVILSDPTTGATIYYTTDGSTPTTSSTLYTGPITVNSTETVSAIGAMAGLTNSPVTSQTYAIDIGLTGISFGEGFSGSTGLVILNGSTQLNDSRLQLTNGGNLQAGAAWYYQPVSVQNFTTDFTFQLSNPAANGITFTLQNDGVNALGEYGSSLGYSPLNNSIAIKFDFFTPVGSGADSTGLYTNGALPTTPAIDLSQTGINLKSDDDFAVHLNYNGTTLSMTITDLVTAAVWSDSWTINIPATIGSNTAYAGFTGGTGGSTASQKILTWSYETTSMTPAATPTFSPAAGTYTSAQAVSIGDSTLGSTVYYTTNGSTPTTSSTQYSGPITVSATETLNAIAAKAGYLNSAVGTAAYNISSVTAAPGISPGTGTYTSVQTVTLTDSTSGAVIHYTFNGTTPTASSDVYSAPLTVKASETLQAIAIASGLSNSPVTSATYTLDASAPVISPAGGTFTSPQTVTMTTATPGAHIYYTTNDTFPTSSSTVYAGPITVSSNEHVVAMAGVTGFTNSPFTNVNFTIPIPAPTFSPVGGTYPSSQSVTISDATPGVTIYYTTNGTTPTTSSTVVSGSITVSTTETLNAIAVINGQSSLVGTAAYNIGNTAATPTFSLASGTYAGTQSVTISDTSSGATIHYTTNGATPTTSSTAYSGAISVSASETLKAIASGNGFSASPVASATYTIASATATPGISPGTGAYTSVQTVTITDATSGAVIYYTLNGVTPTTSSDVYSSPITVKASETLKVLAVAPGYAASPVASATYTLDAAAPIISPAGGYFSSAQTATITTATPGAHIYYTTNNTFPTTSSTVYAGPITVSGSDQVIAMTALTGFTSSADTKATFTISTVAATPTFSPPAGTYTSAQSITISDQIPGAKIYYTTNGTTPATSSALYSGPITVSSAETIKAIAVASGFTNSAVASAVYTGP